MDDEWSEPNYEWMQPKCDTSSCIQIKPVTNGVLLRSSKHLDRIIAISSGEWDALTEAIKTDTWVPFTRSRPDVLPG